MVADFPRTQTRTGRMLAVLLCTLATVGPAWGQGGDRREVFEPGLVVETGARTGSCDVLAFSADGKDLLAVGDDKVVRVWKHAPAGLDENAQVLRWGAYREQRGGIYAMAVPHDKKNPLVAIGGVGLRTSTVAILDRTPTSEKVKQAVVPEVNASVWALAFSPADDRVAIGYSDGSVWTWKLAAGGRGVQRLGKHPGTGQEINKVKYLRFLNDNQLLSVAEDGDVRRWDLDKETPTSVKLLDVPRPAGAVGKPKVFKAVLSADNQWLAVVPEFRTVMVVPLGGGTAREIRLKPGLFPHCLAFSSDGTRLAVGLRRIRAKFLAILGGAVHLYDLREKNPEPTEVPHAGYFPEAVAFHPDGSHLAVAGGDNHEVTLWDLNQLDKPVSIIRGPGRCLWGVALSANGRLLGYQDERSTKPLHPNRLGAGPWRVFDLSRRRRSDADFTPAPVVEKAEGWTVAFDPVDAYRWYVAGMGRRHVLPLDPRRDALPRCYAFVPMEEGRPPRLVVGHAWGASVFELHAGGPRCVRKFTGHQGEVMALAVSADGKTLVTASRDQTIAAWSLAQGWASQRELGAKFIIREGRLLVDVVDDASPAWDAGLIRGDEVTLFAHAGKAVPGAAEQWLEILRDPTPGHECFFRIKRQGQAQTIDMLTSVRQRPLWTFFPTRGGEWVLWRFFDYYYDCSTSGDRWIGWQISFKDPARTPRFYRAEQYRRRFFAPDKVAEIFRTGQTTSLDRILLGDVRAPEVELEVLKDEPGTAAVNVVVSAAPADTRANQQVDRVILWVNDFQFQTWATEGGTFRKTVSIPRHRLRNGSNFLTLQAYNRAGGRGETKPILVLNHAGALASPRLYGLFAGVGNYKKAQPAPLASLNAHEDGRALREAWFNQKGRKLYQDVALDLIPQSEISPDTLLRRLRDLAGKVRPDDRFVLFMGGHGTDYGEILQATRKSKLAVRESLIPGSFWFCCPTFDLTQPSRAGLTSADLYRALAALPCYKLVFLDACHSGTISSNPVRDLTIDGVGPFILAACAPGESAIEHPTIGLGRADAQGLFAIAVVMALDTDFDAADKNKDGFLDAEELAAYVQFRVPDLVDELKREKVKGISSHDTQIPVYFPTLTVRGLKLARK